MNSIDLVVLILIAFNGLLGLVRGAVWQILRLASIVLGVWAAARYGEEFLGRFPATFEISDEIGIHVARIVIFLSVYLIMFGVTNLMQALVKKVKLGGIDRTVGALFGAAKGALFCCLLLYLQFLPFGDKIQIVHDQLYGSADGSIKPSKANRFFLDHLREQIEEAVPDRTRDQIEKTVEDLKDAQKAADALEDK